jgi:hypothetical protein
MNRREAAMRDYTDEQLDVMAEAYLRLRDKVPHEISSTPIALRLVDEIGWGVANGIRDEETLANTALERSNIGGLPDEAI